MKFAMDQGDLFGCYRRFLRTTEKRGTTVLQLAILPDGGVEGAQVLESTIGDEDTTACLVDRASRWKTPFRPSAKKIFRIPVTIN